MNQISQPYYTKHKDQKKEYDKRYTEEHKEHINIRFKEYDDKHNEQMLAKAKLYAQNNKEKLKAWKTAPFTCECGKTIRSDCKSEHLKTKAQIQFMESQQQPQ